MNAAYAAFVCSKRRRSTAQTRIAITPLAALTERKQTMNKAVSALLSALCLAACAPGTYTSDGLASKAGSPDGMASFDFSVASCPEGALGHFSLDDHDWEIPVDLSGHVTDFREPAEFGRGCSFNVQLEYVSDNPDYPGEGTALVCFGGDVELSSTEVFRQVRVSVQSGPYAAYEHDGPIYGEVRSHACDS